MTNNAKQRLRLQFGIKTLLLVMLVSGLLVSWSISKVRRQREQLRFIKELETDGNFGLQVATPIDFEGTSDHWFGQLFDKYYFDSTRVLDTDDFDPYAPDVINKFTLLRDLTSLSYSGFELDLGCLSGLTKLEKLTIIPEVFADFAREFEYPTQIKNATALSRMTNLSEVRICCLESKDLKFLAQCRELQHLDLRNCKIGSLEGLEGHTQLRFLAINDSRVIDLEPIRNAHQIRTLFLSGTSVSDLSPLTGKSLLQKLTLAKTATSDLSPIRDSTKLEYLDASETRITSISALAEAKQLSLLNLAGTNVKDLSPLRGSTTLNEIDLRGCKATDLSPLVGLKASIRLLLDQQIDPPHVDLKRYITRGDL